MIDHGKKNVLGILIDAVDYEAAVERICSAAHQKKPCSVSALAVHGVMTGVLDPVHKYRLNRLDLVVPDGQPVRWAINLLNGHCLRERVYGPDLMLHVCRRAAREKLPVYFYGSTPETLEKLRARLLSEFPSLSIAGAQPSRFRSLTVDEQDAMISSITSSDAMIVFVGLGCPRQEVWAFENSPKLSMSVIAVGAAFNFHAGELKQAPLWMRRCGLEWFFRLVQEPGRLWQRYLILNPHYLLLLITQFFGWRKFDPGAAEPPVEPKRYG